MAPTLQDLGLAFLETLKFKQEGCCRDDWYQEQLQAFRNALEGPDPALAMKTRCVKLVHDWGMKLLQEGSDQGDDRKYRQGLALTDVAEALRQLPLDGSEPEKRK